MMETSSYPPSAERTETRRACEGISEGFHQAETGRTAPRWQKRRLPAIPRNASEISFTHTGSGRAIILLPNASLSATVSPLNNLYKLVNRASPQTYHRNVCRAR